MMQLLNKLQQSIKKQTNTKTNETRKMMKMTHPDINE